MYKWVLFFICFLGLYGCSSKKLQEVGFLKEIPETEKSSLVLENMEELNSENSDFAYVSARMGETVLLTREKGNQKLVFMEEGGARDLEFANGQVNQGAAAVGLDGELIIFTHCGDGDRSCELKAYRKTPAGWLRDTLLLKNINSKSWDGHPYLNPQGNLLIFSSTRPEGRGGKDLYLSRLKDSVFQKPVILNKEVNTPFDEECPFLSADGKGLIFSSNGHKRLGGFDLFLSLYDEKEKRFTPPRPLPKPFNSIYDDLFYYHPLQSRYSYFSSNRPGGKGLYDVYRVKSVPLRDDSIRLVYGKLFDAEFSRKLSGGLLFSVPENDEILGRAYTSRTYGEYYKILENVSGKMGITARSPGRLFQTKIVSLDKISQKVDFYLKDFDSAVDLKVFFDFNSSVLRKESYYDLKAAYYFLRDYEKIAVEVSGHTDNVGDDAYNLNLSRKRAEAVKDFLVSKGIEDGRISAKGYGSAQPRVENDTEEGRAKNRRVEFKIVKK